MSNYKEYLGNSFNFEKGEFDLSNFKRKIKDEIPNINIILLGSTGVGKSSLVNAVFGKNTAKVGVGQPVTQYLEKFPLPDIGITLWDTKGIEAKDYDNTRAQVKSDIEKGFQEAFNKNDDNEAPHMAWLCIKETSGRIQDSDFDLLNIVREFGIPTIIVFTNTMSGGDDFFHKARSLFNEKGYADFIKDRYARVNSVDTKITPDFTLPKAGLKNLLDRIEECLEEVDKNINSQKKKRKEAFLRAQQIDNEKKLSAMIESAEKKVHLAALAAGAAGASPIPCSDAPIIAAIQTAMIYTINKDFCLNIQDEHMTSLVAGILSITAVSQLGKTVVSNVLKFIPGVGTLAGVVISGSTAATITEAIGFAYINVLKFYFNKQSGEVEFPESAKLFLDMFKSSYFDYKK